jgi:hypothetical protein
VRGPEPNDPIGLLVDVGFIEMFEHGNRVLTAIELLRVVGLGAPDDYQPLTPRDDFDDAYARTHQMQVMIVAFVEGPQVLRETLGREPTTAELLQYVYDELESKSLPFDPH